MERPHAGPAGTNWPRAHAENQEGAATHPPTPELLGEDGRRPGPRGARPSSALPLGAPARRPAEPEGGALSDGGRGAQEGLWAATPADLPGWGGGGGHRGGTVRARQAPCGTQVDGHPGDGRAAWGSPGHTAALSRAVSHGVRGPGQGCCVPCPGLSAWQHPPFPEGDRPRREKHIWTRTSARAHLNVCSANPLCPRVLREDTQVG